MQTTQTAVFERRPPRTRLAQYSFPGLSLHSGINAPPAAAQAFVPEWSARLKPCSNDSAVGERISSKTYST